MNKKILSSMLILISLLIMNDQIFSYNPIKSIANYNQAKTEYSEAKKTFDDTHNAFQQEINNKNKVDAYENAKNKMPAPLWELRKAKQKLKNDALITLAIFTVLATSYKLGYLETAYNATIRTASRVTDYLKSFLTKKLPTLEFRQKNNA